MAQIVSIWAPVLGNPTYTKWSPANPTYPAWIWIQNGGDAILVIGGTSALSQAQLAVTGWVGGPLDTRDTPVNAYLKGASDTILPAILSALAQQPTRVLFAGHSLGGAIATFMLWASEIVGRPFLTWLCTIGAPKPLNYDANVVFNARPCARWMTIDDPIPIVMPTVDDAIQVALIFPTYALQRFQHFTQPAGGLQIDGGARISAQVLPQGAAVSFVTSLATWMFQLAQDVTSAHSPERYYMLAKAWQVLNEPPSQVPQHGAPVQTVVPLQVPQRNAAQNAVVEAIRTTQQGLDAVPVVIPPAYVFYAARLGELWTVQFQGTVISVTPHKRAAKGLARTFNAALQRLQLQALVDPTTLATELTQYLQAASDPTSGFNPTMNTTPPS